MAEIYYSKAVNEALDEELARDHDVILIGEDIGKYGGAFGVTKGLWDKYGAERLLLELRNKTRLVVLVSSARNSGKINTSNKKARHMYLILSIMISNNYICFVLIFL